MHNLFSLCIKSLKILREKVKNLRCRGWGVTAAPCVFSRFYSTGGRLCKLDYTFIVYNCIFLRLCIKSNDDL